MFHELICVNCTSVLHCPQMMSSTAISLKLKINMEANHA